MESSLIGFNGTVDVNYSNSVAISWHNERGRYIEYGKDNSYGEIIEPQEYDNYFFRNRAIIHNLEANTTYHYRINDGDKVSKDYTFTTLQANDKKIYEDAEDGTTDKWELKTEQTSIKNIRYSYIHQGDFTMEYLYNRVIQFNGTIVIGAWEDRVRAWSDKTHNTLSWKMSSHGFAIHVRVMTKKGARYLYYTARDNDLGIHKDLKTYIHHGLGIDTRNGEWHTITRNLEDDLKEFEPDNELIEVNGIFFKSINSSMNIDDIIMSNS
jgi:hypothetical protein